MKKLLIIAVSLILVLGICGCGGGQEVQKQSTPAFMLSTTYANAKDCYEAICDYEAGRIDFTEADNILSEAYEYLNIEFGVINRDSSGKYTTDDKYFNAIVLGNVANYRDYLRTGKDDYMGPDYYRESLYLVIHCDSPDDFMAEIRKLNSEQ